MKAGGDGERVQFARMSPREPLVIDPLQGDGPRCEQRPVENDGLPVGPHPPPGSFHSHPRLRGASRTFLQPAPYRLDVDIHNVVERLAVGGVINAAVVDAGRDRRTVQDIRLRRDSATRARSARTPRGWCCGGRRAGMLRLTAGALRLYPPANVRDESPGDR